MMNIFFGVTFLQFELLAGFLQISFFFFKSMLFFEELLIKLLEKMKEYFRLLNFRRDFHHKES